MPDGLIEWNLHREMLCDTLSRIIGEALNVDAERAGEIADDVLDKLEREALDRIRGAAMSIVHGQDGMPRLTMRTTFEIALPEV